MIIAIMIDDDEKEEENDRYSKTRRELEEMDDLDL